MEIITFKLLLFVCVLKLCNIDECHRERWINITKTRNLLARMLSHSCNSEDRHTINLVYLSLYVCERNPFVVWAPGGRDVPRSTQCKGRIKGHVEFSTMRNDTTRLYITMRFSLILFYIISMLEIKLYKFLVIYLEDAGSRCHISRKSRIYTKYRYWSGMYFMYVFQWKFISRRIHTHEHLLTPSHPHTIHIQNQNNNEILNHGGKVKMNFHYWAASDWHSAYGL